LDAEVTAVKLRNNIRRILEKVVVAFFKKFEWETEKINISQSG